MDKKKELPTSTQNWDIISPKEFKKRLDSGLIENAPPPREKRPSESPSKAQTQPRPNPSIGGKSTNKERCTECGNLTEREGQDPLYFLEMGPLCDGCHDNMKSRFCEKWPMRKDQL